MTQRRAAWRRRFTLWWRLAEWPALALVLVASLGLTYSGLRQPDHPPFELDRLYEALWSFGPGWGYFTFGHRGAAFDLAQWLFLFVAAYAVVKAWAVIFREQLKLLWLRRVAGHAVICGLGERGALLAVALRDRGMPVVAIEADRGTPGIDRCAERGGIVLVGDATDGSMLEEARVDRAHYVIALCGNDATNLELAARARSLAGDRWVRPLTCFVHIADPELFALVRDRELVANREPSFRLQAFNVYESGARVLLMEYPIRETSAGPPHVVVIGLGRLASCFIVQAARRWHEEHGSRLRITAVDPDAERKVVRLHERVPALAAVCELLPVTLATSAARFRDGAFLLDGGGRPADRVYVCTGDETEALAAGLALRPALNRHRVPCVVRVSRDTGLDALLAHPLDATGNGNLQLFGMLPRTCRVELLLHGTNEVLAEACHEQYVRAEEMKGQTRASNPSLVPWEQLPEPLRESNRHLADDIARKVEALGYEIVPLADWFAELPTFTSAEVEVMARMEHERWVDERRKAGWSPGRVKNVEELLTPHLVAWEELREPDREKDRVVVRVIPVLLARCGLTVVQGQPR